MISGKNLKLISEKQKKLDKYILENNNIDSNLIIKDKKNIALIVEFFEFINETKCFKFWSNKKPNNLKMIEEFIDGIHFIVSIGNDLDFCFETYEIDPLNNIRIEQLIEKFISQYSNFSREYNVLEYKKMLDIFLSFQILLNFSEQDIIKTYEQKNQINFERQDNGY